MRRPAVLPLLAAAVLLLHLALGEHLAGQMRRSADAAAGAGMQRMRADFVVDLRPSAPPAALAGVLPPSPPPQRLARTPPLAVAPPPDAAASAPAAEAVRDETPDADPLSAEAERPAAADEPQPPADAPAPAHAAAAEPPQPDGPAVAAAAPASGPHATEPGFEWPRSTRLSYRLEGWYRGPVQGSAQVEWLYDGLRYQVHVEVSVGPSFAPLVARRMSSEGQVGAEGLVPRRYEEETRVVLREPRRLVVTMDESGVVLANGQRLPRPVGLQDTASQFVHLTWLFTTQPARLKVGEKVALMLALPRRLGPWTYEVLDAETVHTEAGPIEAVPVRPRRADRAAGELSAELWVAPALQYLPVRFVIRQDEENHVDLLLERLPQQASGPPR